MSSAAPFVLLVVLCQYAQGSNFSTSEFDWPDTTDDWFDTTEPYWSSGCVDEWPIDWRGINSQTFWLCQGSSFSSSAGIYDWTCGQYHRWYFGLEDGVDFVFTNCDSADDMDFTMHLYTAPYNASVNWRNPGVPVYLRTAPWTKITNQSLNNCDDGEDCMYEDYCSDPRKETMAFSGLPEAFYKLEMYSTCDVEGWAGCGYHKISVYCADLDDHDSHDHDHVNTTAEGDDANALPMMMGMMIALICTLV